MKGTTHRILDEKRPLQKLRNGWDENMKIDLVVSEVICENKSCMNVAKFCVRGQDLVIVMLDVLVILYDRRLLLFLSVIYTQYIE
jgi:exosome complex RNA-binding protein Rrp42 (RNase PH superfamily)